MFIDEVVIHVKAGDGGHGCLSFLREKGKPKGGPDGGDGGHGGNVIIRADTGLNTLFEHRRLQTYKAKNGLPGEGNCRHGASADDLIIPVPVGTIIHRHDTGEIVADLVTPGQEVVAAKRGKGGRGNRKFATATHQAPREYEYGEEGEAFDLHLEIKLIADIGLVGLPNAGKSTILSKLTAARPKIASYPFTTLKPQLGIVAAKGFRTLVLADIPGLIEGASQGAGLGVEFLKHIERTNALVHVVDLVPDNGRDPLDNVKTIRKELASFSKSLARRRVLYAGNKIDLPGAEEAAQKLEKALKVKVVRISALAGQGMDELVNAMFDMLADKNQ